MQNRRAFLFSFGALTVSTVVLGACNTIEGVGKDVQRAGDAIEDTARDTRRRNK